MMYLFIDDQDIENVLAPFAGLTQQTLSLSFHRAMRRTESPVLAQTRRLLQQKLDLRNQKRLLSADENICSPSVIQHSGDGNSWFGMNDLPPGVFIGKPKKVAGGLVFRGSYYDKAFATSAQGRLLYMKRETGMKYPITRLKVPIPDDVVVDIEDEGAGKDAGYLSASSGHRRLAGRTRSNVWKSLGKARAPT